MENPILHSDKIKKIIANMKQSPIRKLNSPVNVAPFKREQEQLMDVLDILESNLKNIDNSIRIAVMGEVKAGKSTLINALVGKDIAHTNVVEATASVMEINNCNVERVVMKFKDKVQDMTLEQMKNTLIMNQGQQDFFSTIDLIQVYTPFTRFQGFTLVDTPGLSTVTVKNQERTENYLSNVDVVIWVLNVHHPSQRDVIDKLERVCDFGKPIICIMNRIDETDGIIEELLEDTKGNIGYLTNVILPMNSKLAFEGMVEENIEKVEHSGLLKLLEYIDSHYNANSSIESNKNLDTVLEVQLAREYEIHQNSKNLLEKLSKRMDEDIRELNTYNVDMKGKFQNKINRWITEDAFRREEHILLNETNISRYNSIRGEFLKESYLFDVIQKQYDKLNEELFSDWRSYMDSLVTRIIVDEFNVMPRIKIDQKVPQVNLDSENTTLTAMKQGGVTAGGFGLSLAAYAAWLGPYAPVISLMGAAASFVPPLLIAGAISGAIWKFTDKHSSNNNIHESYIRRDIEQIVKEVRYILEKDVAHNLMRSIYETSDQYFNESVQLSTAYLGKYGLTPNSLSILIEEIDTYKENLKE